MGPPPASNKDHLPLMDMSIITSPLATMEKGRALACLFLSSNIVSALPLAAPHATSIKSLPDETRCRSSAALAFSPRRATLALLRPARLQTFPHFDNDSDSYRRIPLITIASSIIILALIMNPIHFLVLSPSIAAVIAISF